MSDLTINTLKRKLAELEQPEAYPPRVFQVTPQGDTSFRFEGVTNFTAVPADVAAEHKAKNMSWDTSKAYFNLLEQKRKLLRSILPQFEVLERMQGRLTKLRLEYPQMFPQPELELTSDEEETAEEKTPGAA